METEESKTTSIRDHEVTVLLHEDEQYREGIQHHESRLISVGLAYVSGVIAAAAWLGGKLLEGESGATMMQRLEELASGPFFYVFTALPVVTAVWFLIVIRDWASILERIQLLREVRGDIVTILYNTSDGAEDRSTRVSLLRHNRGDRGWGGEIRVKVEAILAGYWAFLVMLLCVFVLFLMWNDLTSFSRCVAWGVGCVSVGMCIVGMFIARKGYGISRKGTG